MHGIAKGARGLWLLVDLNWERVATPMAILVGLAGGAAIGAELLHLVPGPLHP